MSIFYTTGFLRTRNETET